LIKIVVLVKVMITTQNNHKRVLYKHWLNARTAHARRHVILSITTHLRVFLSIA